MAHLDAYNRPISYLRISVTDRCNLRCIYCMPVEGVGWRPHDQILRYEEIEMVARAAAELGISKIRLTGGEPLVRLGIVDLVRGIASIPGIDDLAMTTNGVLLSKVADDLARAGLHRVNISLDTLNADRFRQITRCGDLSAVLSDVLAGIEAARRVGLQPIKINTVVIRGMNDDEVVDLAAKTLEAEWWNVRFIELMPVGNGELVDAAWEKRVVTAREVRERIETALGELEPAKISTGSGPARYHRLPGA
ncbi:MAG: radical SAM protein, partial [Anaerolineae bacterium]